MISLSNCFPRDSDKHQQSHRMQRFARQNLMNRIDYDQQHDVVGDVMHHLYMERSKLSRRILDSRNISLIGSDKPNHIGHG